MKVRKGGRSFKLNERFHRASDASSHRSKVLSTYVRRGFGGIRKYRGFPHALSSYQHLALIDVPELVWTGFQLLPADLKFGRGRKVSGLNSQGVEFDLSVRLLRTPPLNHLLRYHTRLPDCSAPVLPETTSDPFDSNATHSKPGLEMEHQCSTIVDRALSPWQKEANKDPEQNHPSLPRVDWRLRYMHVGSSISCRVINDLSSRRFRTDLGIFIDRHSASVPTLHSH